MASQLNSATGLARSTKIGEKNQKSASASLTILEVLIWQTFDMWYAIHGSEGDRSEVF